VADLAAKLNQMETFDKIMVGVEGYEAFSEAYPFMCVNSDSTPEQHLRAKARYPSILGDNIYLGNFVNATNFLHMKQLGITKVIGFTPKPDENL